MRKRNKMIFWNFVEFFDGATQQNQHENEKKNLCVVCQMLDDFQHQDSWSHVVVGKRSNYIRKQT